MSGTTEPASRTPAGPEMESAPDPPSTRRSVLKWTDLLVPVFCVLAIAADVLYLANADLDSIVRRAVDPATVTRQTLDHLKISILIALLVMAVAVPLGVLVTRRRFAWISPGVLAIANAGQAAPSIGLLAIIGIFYIGLWAVVGVLAAYSVLPVLRNTIVGLQQVDSGVKDAARGMGMSPLGVLFRVELPLAVPIIGAGARTALVLAVATVAFGDYIGAGGLGGLLFGSIKLGRNEVLVLASLLIAVLALLVDWAGGLVQRSFTPRGIR
ncbi:ABC transporter permease [Aeromicrobium sp.]|uniref:ABC transporter permease n=1 Tax=Aeromicrobium sp. TaxID=1871063 RepID=UPI003C44B8D6